jgi:anti-anti-sigma factor
MGMTDSNRFVICHLLENVLVVKLGGLWGYERVDPAFEILKERVTRSGLDVVVDLSDVGKMDTHALRLLLDCHDRATELGRRLVVACAPYPVSITIQILGMDKILGCYSSIDDALAALDGTHPLA